LVSSLPEKNTSANGYYYDRDARYEYYAYGPLQRLELGHDKVQGLDYAYTLQGWLKGINSPTGEAAHDGTNTSEFSADAFATALSYYDKDFVAPNSVFQAVTQAANGYAPKPEHDLYNGNISAWVGKLQGETVPSGSQYRYDQLNRLREAKRIEKNSNQWPLVTNHKLESNYEYDANGNLTKLNRYDQNGNLMDNLTYSYADGNNHLDTVTDVVSTAYLKDLEGTNTYLYDANGNMRRDVKEGIDITWDTYGKVKKIEPVSGTTRPIIRFLYDAQGNRVQKLTDNTASGTDSATYYIRDSQGNTMAAYRSGRTYNTTVWGSTRQDEISLYGSERLGMYSPDYSIPSTTSARYIDTVSVSDTVNRFLDKKSYELKDHLGNVRAVVSDQKASSVSVAANGSGPDSTLILSLSAKLLSSNNYYPFGMEEPGSGVNAQNYRYGYNGKEKDQKGEWGLSNYDYGARIYNPAIARWLSLDPLMNKYPYLSPYNFVANNPIIYVDKDGRDFEVAVNHKEKTIVVKATYYVLEKDASRAQNAANHWNGTTNYQYVVNGNDGKSTTYNIKFELTIQPEAKPGISAKNDPSGNLFRSLPNDDEDFKGQSNREGVTKGNKYSFVRESNAGTPDELVADAHEIGHTLLSGYKVSKVAHSSTPGDLMNTSLTDGGMNIGKADVQNILKTAGLGGLDSPEVTSKSNHRPEVSNVSHTGGSKPRKFEKGYVKEN
jgi:RHS repeat-associated protein